MSEDRHSQADPVELITDPTEKAQREAENGVRQFKEALEIIRSSIGDHGGKFRLTQSIILRLHQKALEGIHPLAGTYRNSPVYIGKSNHFPPAHTEVPDLVAEMCAYVNDNWHMSGIYLAAYLLWRMNWIHPFADGNGRTARVVSYLVLSVKLGSLLPGTPTIPDQIAAGKTPYYKALEGADDSWKRGIVAIADMEAMLEGMLAMQLLKATEEAAI
ncbi:Fic family protein [Mesorhizobium sp. B2-9-1]|uniref:Fic family protein n=1 Tax=Mesorhizobium sp. B2-9-1 TaxID=2589898 RepID=UPI00112E283C|nr:Fic family protein [Mesorhizobium sp. B2-9-1]TPI48841.1 Fic family protein [Mesorhizobium sp. B2-9-1]